MNNYLRGATSALAIAALCAGFSSSTTALAAKAGGSTQAAIIPSTMHSDSYEFGWLTSEVADDTSAMPTTQSAHHYGDLQLASASGATPSTRVDVSAASNAPPVSPMPSIRAFGFMTPNDLETKSLKSLYQLARLTTPAQPHLDVTLFGGGLVSEDYYLTDEGIQLEQSLTEGIGLVGRATGYQLWIEKNATSPLQPSNNTANRLNFGRFQAGFDLSPAPGFNFVFLGGHDVGDSDAWTVESDISMWFMLNSPHPFNVFIAPVHNFQNDVTSSEIDFRVIAAQTPDWVLLLGAGGSVYGGGFIDGLEGQGGPIVGVYNRLYQLGADLQFGYGSPGFYGELTLYKTFSIPGL